MIHEFIHAYKNIKTKNKIINNFLPFCRLPFWPYIKLLFCMWLVLPMFSGAAYIYSNFVRKYAKIGMNVGGGTNYTDEQRRVLQMMSLDARKSVQDYVDRFGWDSVEKAIKAVYSTLVLFFFIIYNPIHIFDFNFITFVFYLRLKEKQRSTKMEDCESKAFFQKKKKMIANQETLLFAFLFFNVLVYLCIDCVEKYFNGK